MGYRPRVTSVAIVGLLLAMLTSEAASQPPTVTEPPLVIEGRVLWIDFGSQTLELAPANGSPAITMTFTAFVRATAKGSVGTSTCGSPASFPDRALGSRYSSSTW